MKHLFLIALLFSFLFIAPHYVLADFLKGQEAFASKDYLLAITEWEEAAAHGHVEAQANLGWLYSQGIGVKQDFEQAYKWHKKAADQDFAESQTELGTMYFHGNGVAQDYSEALRWYLKAAKKDAPSAVFALASMYGNGLGVSPDIKKSFEYGSRSAEMNDLGGQLLLAQLYENGLGIRASMVKALGWYSVVAFKSNIDFPEYKTVPLQASAAARKLVPNMTIEQIAEATKMVMEWRPGDTSLMPYNPPLSKLSDKAKTAFFQGEVKIVDFNFEVTKFLVVENNAIIEVKNATHVRLVANPMVLPKSFNIITPEFAINVIEGEIPKNSLHRLPLAHYLLLRKVVNDD